MEYFEFLASENHRLEVYFEQENESLLVKVPFNLPYHVETNFAVTPNELVVYKGEFYRSVTKAFKNDTVYTAYQRENLTRQNIFELMGQVSQDFDKDENPAKSLVRVLKNFSSHFYQPELKQTLFFWNFKTRPNLVFRNKLFDLPCILLNSPPPKFS